MQNAMLSLLPSFVSIPFVAFTAVIFVCHRPVHDASFFPSLSLRLYQLVVRFLVAILFPSPESDIMSRWLRRLWSGREAKTPGAGGQEGATEKRRWSFWRPRECLPAAAAARGNPALACWAKCASDEDEPSQRAVAVGAAGAGLLADGHGTLRAAAVVIQTAFRGFLVTVFEYEYEYEYEYKYIFYIYYFKARKALKALKALIKLQALARGHLIRKQAVTTLRRMEALARAQATTIRARRSLVSRSPSTPLA